MDLVLLLSLCLCGWPAASAARYRGTDKPGIIVDNQEINQDETVKVSCLVPIDYTGGDCRLFRGNSAAPFSVMRASSFVCVFHLSSHQLLGSKAAGSRVFVKCDYVIQEYQSASSDQKGIIVWASRPSPVLTVDHHFLSFDDSVEVSCTPPIQARSCHFFAGETHVAKGSCHRNLTGQQLAIWRDPSVLHQIHLTCTYQQHRYVRSEPSNHHLLFVVDNHKVTSSVDCKVPVSRDELRTLQDVGHPGDVIADGDDVRDVSWMFGEMNDFTVRIQATNSSMTHNETCVYTQ